MNGIWEFIKGLELRQFNEASVVLRFVLAVICGGLIGIEREHKHRPAGFRTHILVCLGAAATTLTGQYLLTLSDLMNLPVSSDPARLGAQVISGIGFIGAGTIIVTRRREVKGLTTAAGLWTSAIIGLAIGVGYYEVAVYATFLILITEILLSRLDWFLLSHAKNINIYVEYTEVDNLTEIMSEIKRREISITDVEVAKARGETEHRISAIITLQIPRRVSQNEVLSAILKLDGVRDVEEL
jgi:putative Mg2+ transporter-C (MgtC) family protein